MFHEYRFVHAIWLTRSIHWIDFPMYFGRPLVLLLFPISSLIDTIGNPIRRVSLN